MILTALNEVKPLFKRRFSEGGLPSDARTLEGERPHDSEIGFKTLHVARKMPRLDHSFYGELKEDVKLEDLERSFGKYRVNFLTGHVTVQLHHESGFARIRIRAPYDLAQRLELAKRSWT